MAEATSATPRLSIVVAMAANRVIGARGGLPWRLPSDLKTFRRLTLGRPVVMGRKTFASIGKPLDGRDNIVVTRDIGFAAPGVIVCTTIAAAVAEARRCAQARGVDEVMIVGGAEIYAAILPEVGRIYLTEVDARPDGDATFPALDPADWRETSRQPIPRTPRDDHDATLVVLDRSR